MLAWRILLYSSVRSLMNWFALSVAFFIATMRALCSEARASRIHLENLILNVIRQHNIEHYLGGRLEDIAQHRIDIFICVPGGFLVFFGKPKLLIGKRVCTTAR